MRQTFHAEGKKNDVRSQVAHICLRPQHPQGPRPGARKSKVNLSRVFENGQAYVYVALSKPVAGFQVIGIDAS
jgi:hypothetical protein